MSLYVVLRYAAKATKNLLQISQSCNHSHTVLTEAELSVNQLSFHWLLCATLLSVTRASVAFAQICKDNNLPCRHQPRAQQLFCFTTWIETVTQTVVFSSNQVLPKANFQLFSKITSNYAFLVKIEA